MRSALWVLGLGPWMLGEGDFGIVVDAAAPDALCPAIEPTREAVRARLGRIDVPQGERWSALYTIVHSPGTERGDRIRLELRDPNGELKLQRDLPMAGESCTTLAQIIALVLERYFRDLSAGTAQADPETTTPGSPFPSPSAHVGPSPPAVPSALQELPRETATPARSSRPAGFLGLFSGVSTVTGSAGVGIGGSAKLGHPMRLRWTAFAPFGRDEEVLGEGMLQLAEYPVRLAVVGLSSLGSLDLEVGPELLVALERGSASGLDDARSGWRWVGGAGLQAAATYWVSSRWGLELGVSGDVVARGFARVFSVGDEEVLRPEQFRGLVRVGLDFALFE